MNPRIIVRVFEYPKVRVTVLPRKIKSFLKYSLIILLCLMIWDTAILLAVKYGLGANIGLLGL